MVGASMACALAEQGLNIAVVEAFPFKSDSQPSYDARCIALASSSKQIFDSIGVWQSLKRSATAINTIHVSDRGHFGNTRMEAAKLGVAAMGYVLENRDIGQALMDRMAQSSNIELICPAKLVDLKISEESAEATLDREGEHHTFSTRLLIAADGGNSAVRKLLGIENDTVDYQQTAVISTVTPEASHQNVAYERFTDSGPLALLPLSQNRCSLVYTVNADAADDVLSLDDKEFLALLQRRFGFRLGHFVKTGKRFAFPLSLSRIKESIRSRVVFIGNAAHTLHPVAGQGFNLGIRDVAALAEVLVDASRAHADIGSIETLKRYEDWRNKDQEQTANYTDKLVRIFSNDFFPLNSLRSKGLIATNIFSPAKRVLARQAMGMNGKLPRLARGAPL